MSIGPDSITAGQTWTYRAPRGYESSRLVVGAVVRFSQVEPIVCCGAIDAPPPALPHALPDEAAPPVTIPFVPLTMTAFVASVVDRIAAREPIPDGFFPAFEAWRRDPRGMSAFNVAFEGSLDRLIALQMAEIANVDVT